MFGRCSLSLCVGAVLLASSLGAAGQDVPAEQTGGRDAASNAIRQVPPIIRAPNVHEGGLRLARVMLPLDDRLEPKIAIMTRDKKMEIPVWLMESSREYDLKESEYAKLEAYALTVPEIVDAIVRRVAPMTVQRIGVQLSSVLSVEEADQIAEFLESEAGLEFQRAMSAVADQPDEASAVAEGMSRLPPAALKELVRFVQTPGGRAFRREQATIEGVVQEELSRSIQGPLNAKLLTDLCTQVSNGYCRN